MGATFSRVKSWINGETLTHTDLNAEFDNILTNLTPAGVDDASTNVAAMRTTSDPYAASTEVLATSLQTEIQQIRYLLAQISGETYWYVDPDNSLINTASNTFANVTTTTAVLTNTVSERTAASGVTIDGVLCKDNNLTVGTSGQVVTDTIAEKTADTGVTIDGLLIKDSVALTAKNLSMNQEQSATHATAAAISFTGVTSGDRIFVSIGCDCSMTAANPTWVKVSCAKSAGTATIATLNNYTVLDLMVSNPVASVLAGYPQTSGIVQVTGTGDGNLTLTATATGAGAGVSITSVQIYAYLVKEA